MPASSSCRRICLLPVWELTRASIVTSPVSTMQRLTAHSTRRAPQSWNVKFAVPCRVRLCSDFEPRTGSSRQGGVDGRESQSQRILRLFFFCFCLFLPSYAGVSSSLTSQKATLLIAQAAIMEEQTETEDVVQTSLPRRFFFFSLSSGEGPRPVLCGESPEHARTSAQRCQRLRPSVRRLVPCLSSACSAAVDRDTGVGRATGPKLLQPSA